MLRIVAKIAAMSCRKHALDLDRPEGKQFYQVRWTQGYAKLAVHA